MSLNWNGDQIKAKMLAAAIKGVNDTMYQCVVDAKNNHPGWQNRTGTAEGSVRVTTFAKTGASQFGSKDAVYGIWGSRGVNYVIWLELKYGSFLRNSKDKNYKNLHANIRAAYK